jgi:hypothetical protein
MCCFNPINVPTKNDTPKVCGEHKNDITNTKIYTVTAQTKGCHAQSAKSCNYLAA